MKIFSSFDTEYKKTLVSDMRKRFSPQDVHLIEKSALFLFVKVYLPILISLIVGIVISTAIYYFLDIDSTQALIAGIITMFFTILPYNIVKKYIDYKMDYCIVTPEDIVLAEQSGIFQRQIRTLDTSKIKSISVYKKHFFMSVFNNGSIVFMSDGDDNNL